MGSKLLSPKIENTYWAKSKMAPATLLFTSHILFLSQKISVLLSWPRGVLTFLTSNKAAAPLFDIFSSAFALWANAELYILGPSLPFFLSFFLSFSLSPSERKLEKLLNFDATTLKFCMRHPWTQSLRFRENQIVCMSLSLLVGSLPY